MKYIFIFNPAAGKNNKKKISVDEIRAYCESAGLDYEIQTTEHHGHATKLAEAAAETATPENPLRIIAVGGDGTLCETANGLMNRPNVELGCLPCGSGNDYIKSFGTVDDFFDLASYIQSDSVPIDAISAGALNSINICSLGLDANINYEAVKIREKNNRISGPKSYDKATLKCIMGKIYNRLRITVDDDKVFEGKYVFALAASGKCYGGGYYGAPMADPTDGVLDFIFIKAVSNLKAITLVGDYKSGAYIGKRKFRKLVSHYAGRKIRVESLDGEAIINVDGESDIISDVTMEIMPAALRFIAPKKYLDGRKSAGAESEKTPEAVSV